LLLVEDNEANADMLSRRLLRQVPVLIATDGLQAVDMATSAQPDLVLMDISLPKIDVGKRRAA
jgi:CheY-like chemotaxis protein